MIAECMLEATACFSHARHARVEVHGQQLTNALSSSMARHFEPGARFACRLTYATMCFSCQPWPTAHSSRCPGPSKASLPHSAGVTLHLKTKFAAQAKRVRCCMRRGACDLASCQVPDCATNSGTSNEPSLMHHTVHHNDLMSVLVFDPAGAHALHTSRARCNVCQWPWPTSLPQAYGLATRAELRGSPARC